MINEYLKGIFKVRKVGDATEESYYSTLEKLLNDYAISINKTNVHVTIVPKKTDAGNPDFRIWDGKQHIIGYIEAKAPTILNLDKIEKTDQLKRYLSTFPNLILSNFLEFRLYRDGVLIDSIQIVKPAEFLKVKKAPIAGKVPEFFSLLEKYYSFAIPKVYSAKNLAIELAKRTRFLRDEVISEELKGESGKGKGYIVGFFEAFKKYLIGGLTKEEFADFYSQTITFGLFVARMRSENGFNRKLAYDFIPPTIGILRDVFKYVSLGILPIQMEWIIDDISEVLAVTDVKEILHEYFHEGKGKDPIFHFYETFLAQYSPEVREKRGVYYTPESVVSYIVRSLHILLKQDFNRDDGFANEFVTVLDPAAGTLTFLAETAKHSAQEFISKYGEGGKDSFIREHIIQNFYGFELMMAPYAIGHLKMSFLLEELGYKIQEDERFKLYITNTLEMEELAQASLPGMMSLSKESHLAGKVKKKQPILVILGNPPYSGVSANLSEKEVAINKGADYIKNYQIQKVGGQYKLVPQTKKAIKDISVKQKTWIGELIEDYKIINGKWLEEKNPKWLQDDYVKFIRFAQWKIDQSGEGILGFITNHSYLENPTFRGMRQSLLNSFNKIYILDLHGSTKLKEKCPDGSKDECVFDIQQGVSIGIFIKTKEKKKENKTYHAEIWGIQKSKYDWLSENDIKTTPWKKISPKPEYYLFSPVSEKLNIQFQSFISIKDIFEFNNLAIQTHRDKFVIDIYKDELEKRIHMLRDSSISNATLIEQFGLKEKIGNKNLKTVRNALINDQKWESYFKKILYRPFDIRHIYYSNLLIDRSRYEIMRHMFNKNLGLLLPRRAYNWRHALITENLVVDVAISSASREANYLFPLYLYPDIEKGDLFHQKGSSLKKYANFKSHFEKKIKEFFEEKLVTEDIFYYIYSILYSNTYRKKFESLLKIDFPRIPFTKDFNLCSKMADLGKKLVNLHLLKSKDVDPPIVKFQGKGDNIVAKIRFNEKQKRLYFNEKQFFEGITKEIWEYKIGGYQICEKWLKDRKEKTLTFQEIKHFCKVSTALFRTIKCQKEIDKIYDQIEKDIIGFNS